MRQEASLEQWKVLYEAATRIKELKPWEKFWDMDLIGICNGDEEDTVFYSILGRGGDCYGIAVYEGYEELNTFMMLTMQERMNLTSEYAMFHQKNLTCYWGNREELTDKQRKTIKELGYTYRGKNQWLYFLSFEPGYFPYNMNQEEVLRMSEHMQNLELALKCYEEDKVQVNFESGNMFHVVLNEDKEILSRGEAPLPFTAFQYGNLLITDEELLSDLAKVPKCNAILEADVSVLGGAVSDKKYERPANPALPLLGDAKTGVIIKFEMVEPEEDAMVMLAEILIGFIFQYGAPKEVRVSNVIVEAGLEQVCEVCGIKLRRVKRLPGLEEFKNSMRRFG
ncbi:MAG: hypothetical protein IKB01_03675 [Lachnospiraceae bacterium]|nr:hypothetical protein [Lachnospiraceae bacterium]MBR2401859.1 hypothetical protein [Lachnospiraceae bacterium]MBR4060176.1 hypothetical protein [Lachnospiraceae bacterium]